MTQENTVIRKRQVVTLTPVWYSFGEYIAWRRHNKYQFSSDGESTASAVIPIEHNRRRFHGYLPDFAKGERWALDTWHRWWEKFIRSQDAADLQDTQACAVR